MLYESYRRHHLRHIMAQFDEVRDLPLQFAPHLLGLALARARPLLCLSLEWEKDVYVALDCVHHLALAGVELQVATFALTEQLAEARTLRGVTPIAQFHVMRV